MNLAKISSAKLVFALAAAAALAAHARPAEACTPELPTLKAAYPAADATGVPTNALVWIDGPAETITITPEIGVPVTTVLARVSPSLFFFHATPATKLSANTRYTVNVTGDSRGSVEPLTYSFTTGAADETRVPAAPAMVKVTAAQLPTGGNSCIPTGYRVGIEAQPVEAAAFYELLEKRDGVWVVTGHARASLFNTYASAMPTPTYTIRPMSITGKGPDEATLPAKSAETFVPLPEGDGDGDGDDDGGCSASGGASSGASFAIALGLLGLVLGQRRRRAFGEHQ